MRADTAHERRLDGAVSVLAGPEPARRPAWRVQLPAASGTSLRGRRVAV